MQEERFCEILEENEQRKEFERLKAFEADARKQATGGHPRPSDTVTASLAEMEQVIEKILERHDLTRRFEGGSHALGTEQRREASPAAGPDQEAETQRTIDQILETLLQRQHIGKATELLERLLYKSKQDSRSDRHWILTEVLAYVDEYFLPEQRQGESSRPGLYHHHHHHLNETGCRFGCEAPSTRYFHASTPSRDHQPGLGPSGRWQPIRLRPRVVRPTACPWEPEAHCWHGSAHY